MLTEQEFAQLLGRTEGDTLDFKREWDLSDAANKCNLVKDVISMANTPRDSTSYIVFGVDKQPDGTFTLLGVDIHPDEAAIQQQFNDVVYPIPNFTYSPITYQDKSFGVISVPEERIGPCCPTRDKWTILSQWRIYFRRGSSNVIASPDEQARIFDWFGKTTHPRPIFDKGGPVWESVVSPIYSPA